MSQCDDSAFMSLSEPDVRLAKSSWKIHEAVLPKGPYRVTSATSYAQLVVFVAKWVTKYSY